MDIQGYFRIHFSLKLYIKLILGSSIVTSLCESESKPKHVGLLKINKSNFKIKPLKLQSVRPFIFDNLILHDHDIKMRNCVSLANAISQYVDQYIENNIMPKVAEQLTGISIILILIVNIIFI